MISGIATAVKAIKPDCAVLAAEPEGLWGNAADCAESNDEAPSPSTCPFRRRWRTAYAPNSAISRGPSSAIRWTTSSPSRNASIVEAMRLIYERMKLVVEPSGAAGLAAALSGQFGRWNRAGAGWGKTMRCRKVGVVLCGGNVDLGVLWKSYGL